MTRGLGGMGKRGRVDRVLGPGGEKVKKPTSIDIKAGPTQGEFILWADQFTEGEIVESCLAGPRGEGKTEGGWMAMTYHAAQEDVKVRPIPWAILRDTWKNLKRTTLDNLMNPRPGSFCETIRPYLIVGGEPPWSSIELPGFWRAELFGIDSLGDISKLQGSQLGGIWWEEPAPAAVSDIGSGIQEEAYFMGLTSLRYPCKRRRSQITMNYPDEEHWTWRRFGHCEGGVGTRRLFRIPRGENAVIDAGFRNSLLELVKDHPGLMERLVLGQPSMAVLGERVAPEYSSEIHRAKIDLEPHPGVEGFRFWDGGLNPTCILAQVTPLGFLHVFPDSFVGKNMGLKQLITQYVKPLMKMKYRAIPSWRDIGDPNMAISESSDSSMSGARIIRDELGGYFEGGIDLWQPRREAVKISLLREIDGSPWVRISLNEKYLSRALRGGWHYRRDAGGAVLVDKPVKDESSHPGDAFSYGVANLLKFINVRKGWLEGRYPQLLLESRTMADYGGPF